MSRPLRIVFPGALYHLIARGNARERCSRDDHDHQLFLELLEHVVDRYGWLAYAYCLMDNHYHLVAETPRPNLPVGMRQLNGLYARRFNRRHDRCGHVFQARYRAILVEQESQLLSTCRYAILNPVRAAICARPDDYRWSSYRATVGLEPPPPFLSLDRLLARLGGGRRIAQRRFRDFVLEAEAGLEEHVRGERLGSERFLREQFGYKPPLAEIPRARVEPLPPCLDEIFAGEPLPVASAYRRHGYTIAQIAAHLGCHYATVSRRLRREEAALRKCKT